MALVVQLLRFTAVVNGQEKPAMQPTRRLFDPIARSEIHFGHLAFTEDYSLCIEVLGDCTRGEWPEFLAKSVLAVRDVDLSEFRFFHNHAMHRKRVKEFV